ncbi:hypothetical protein SPRG_01373 [Saprolegnia parasitica CBS 223.65]|uniref:USP domain-containing protein n=1 Tax=Saprolegnia parasitica (strain CBS 223.65) TaxID=695850 RepID=A0A067CTS1_SAPPC|nr:hypothetical protein SPRG_01373 [Saprolegnia parasitica CBS 223.65]KDO34099.1 hypothetical protein SPRG_01373 [Saprolegnia parasitica CBS 223.65]|eukprot:XP_012194982.1 hypothetical protein SPRG_01373 [Saprolegnia parasitica CBS 223.65]
MAKEDKKKTKKKKKASRRQRDTHDVQVQTVVKTSRRSRPSPSPPTSAESSQETKEAALASEVAVLKSSLEATQGILDRVTRQRDRLKNQNCTDDKTIADLKQLLDRATATLAEDDGPGSEHDRKLREASEAATVAAKLQAAEREIETLKQRGEDVNALSLRLEIANCENAALIQLNEEAHRETEGVLTRMQERIHELEGRLAQEQLAHQATLAERDALVAVTSNRSIARLPRQPVSSRALRTRSQQLTSAIQHYTRCPDVVSSLASPVSAGLKNLGLTCYINAVLHSLAHTDFRSKASDEHDNAFAMALADVLTAIRNGDTSWIGDDHPVLAFHIGHQEDVREYYDWLLDQLESTSVPVAVMLYHDVTLTCVTCNDARSNTEHIYVLALTLESASGSVANALAEQYPAGGVESTEKVDCGTCKVKVQNHTSRERVLLSPQVLVVDLLRFNATTKLRHKVINDHEIMFNEASYELVAVVVHLGEFTAGGHYVAYVRTHPNEWYLMDDNKPLKWVLPDEIEKLEGYLLFYQCKVVPVANAPVSSLVTSIDSNKDGDKDDDDMDGGSDDDTRHPAKRTTPPTSDAQPLINNALRNNDEIDYEWDAPSLDSRDGDKDDDDMDGGSDDDTRHPAKRTTPPTNDAQPLINNALRNNDEIDYEWDAPSLDSPEPSSSAARSPESAGTPSSGSSVASPLDRADVLEDVRDIFASFGPVVNEHNRKIQEEVTARLTDADASDPEMALPSDLGAARGEVAWLRQHEICSNFIGMAFCLASAIVQDPDVSDKMVAELRGQLRLVGVADLQTDPARIALVLQDVFLTANFVMLRRPVVDDTLRSEIKERQKRSWLVNTTQPRLWPPSTATLEGVPSHARKMQTTKKKHWVRTAVLRTTAPMVPNSLFVLPHRLDPDELGWHFPSLTDDFVDGVAAVFIYKFDEYLGDVIVDDGTKSSAAGFPIEFIPKKNPTLTAYLVPRFLRAIRMARATRRSVAPIADLEICAYELLNQLEDANALLSALFRRSGVNMKNMDLSWFGRADATYFCAPTWISFPNYACTVLDTVQKLRMTLQRAMKKSCGTMHNQLDE